jgi:AcrR family transcriptional regulator
MSKPRPLIGGRVVDAVNTFRVSAGRFASLARRTVVGGRSKPITSAQSAPCSVNDPCPFARRLSNSKLAQRAAEWQRIDAIVLAWWLMDGSTRRTRGVQRGPRSHQVVEKVRAATMAELARVGFPGLTIEGVAKAANVNRTTIYRRWPSKGALLLAVLEPGLERFDHDPDTGSLGGDLLALMLMIGETAALPEGQAVHRAVGSTSDELKELVEAVNDRALGAFRRTLDRARARGEVGPTEDTEVIAHLAFFGVVLWGETRERAPTEEECRRILRVVLAPLAGSTSAPPARSDT